MSHSQVGPEARIDVRLALGDEAHLQGTADLHEFVRPDPRQERIERTAAVRAAADDADRSRAALRDADRAALGLASERKAPMPSQAK